MHTIHDRMRDVCITTLIDGMAKDPTIFFLTADLGSPKLDVLCQRFPDRVINIGIAEQNLVNIAAGMALEGFKVFAYAIAPFITMRCYEQIRNNLALLSTIRPMNVTLLGVGAGLSYDVSGPTHQAMEDISIMRTLPNIEVMSPSDTLCARSMIDYSLNTNSVRYIRLDSKPLPHIYNQNSLIDIKTGFCEIASGTDLCIVSTGYMTHKALAALHILGQHSTKVGLIDIFILKSFDNAKLAKILKRYKAVLTIEEAFIGKGGLDSAILHLMATQKINASFSNIGLRDHYQFRSDARDAILETLGLGEKAIARRIKRYLAKR